MISRANVVLFSASLKLYLILIMNSILECGNTEAKGFLCRLHLAAKKSGDKKRFSRGERPA
jgi:hypothetical protein